QFLRMHDSGVTGRQLLEQACALTYYHVLNPWQLSGEAAVYDIALSLSVLLYSNNKRGSIGLVASGLKWKGRRFFGIAVRQAVGRFCFHVAGTLKQREEQRLKDQTVQADPFD